MLSDSSYESDEPSKKRRPHKRRKISSDGPLLVEHSEPMVLFEPLLERFEISDAEDSSFDDFAENVLTEYTQARADILERSAQLGLCGQLLRPLTRSEVSTFIDYPPASLDPIVSRKLKLKRERRRAKITEPRIEFSPGHITPLPPPRSALPVNAKVIDALYSIQTTPYEHSFLSRLSGIHHGQTKNTALLAVDWETSPPWIKLMDDIRAHYSLAHPERDQPAEIIAPITYMSLQESHLDQVHELLARVFWTGINVRDSLQYSPERCTVIATYKKLVVGVAILSSPQETYITYLAVKAGWDNAQIATSMLYHLIMLNPNRDITLHVSANNSAMLLYNRFGFKAEEFVAGFYEDYLDPQSRASKNAFRLRLRRQ